MKDFRKYLVLALLALLVTGTVGVGLYFKHYFVVFAFSVWLFLEMWIQRAGSKRQIKALWAERKFIRKSSFLSSLASLYTEWSSASLMLLDEELSTLKREAQLTLQERKDLEDFTQIVELKRLLTRTDLKGKKALRQLYCYQKNPLPVKEELWTTNPISIQDMTESAVLVSHLYRKVMLVTLSRNSWLAGQAKLLLEGVFGLKFDEKVFHDRIEQMSDHMQREGGLPFLILNLLKMQQWEMVKELSIRLLTSNIEVEEEVRSALYWLTEIEWFARTKSEPIQQHDQMIRYLYHLCFTNPERAAFLEIDSQFFSQFETVNELAKEAFLFKETLADKFLELWKEQEGLFDPIFQNLLEILLGKQSKIYEDHRAWERLWAREKEQFSRDYLYVVEGNLCYATGHHADAKEYYERALELNPGLRSALLNSVFALAKLGQAELHTFRVQKIIESDTLYPSSLYVAGNSYLLLGAENEAEKFYNELKTVSGWEKKTHYYQSTFCFENGLFEKALLYARMAHAENPGDSAILYHLSLCYNAVGEKERALEAVKNVPEAPHWLDYYRFTLERDSGKHQEASKTLMDLPVEYFEDPEELESALEFARENQDLTLLRKFRNR